MFGLPLETTLVLFGSVAFWIVYTLIFLWRSRRWSVDETRASVDERQP